MLRRRIRFRCLVWQKDNLLVAQADLIIETMRNWGQSVVLWNLALDQNHAPHLGGCTDCRGVVTIDHSKSPATVTPRWTSPLWPTPANLSPRVLFASIPSHPSNRRSTCLQGNLLRFGGCSTALKFRCSIEFCLGSAQGFHLFVQLSQLIVCGRIIRRELHRFFQIPLRVW